MAQLSACMGACAMGLSDAPLSIYIHIPFCSVRCSYCAFNTYTDLNRLIPDYVDALCRDLVFAARHNPHETVHSVYFGGGTPSLLPAEQFGRLLDQLRCSFALPSDCEISLEANPDNLTGGYLKDLRRLGFNRLSIGMQSADAAILRMFDRQHDLAAVAAAMNAARRAGFDNVNLDVIFASPNETLADWRRTVETVLQFEPEHVSMYGLELKGGTVLRQRVDAGELPKPDDDLFADMYELASAYLEAGGYCQYEISNWRRPGKECRHNLQYWRNLAYIGVGAGAHGFAGGYRYSTIAAPERYISALGGEMAKPAPFPLTPAVAKYSLLDAAEEMYETVMMGMRLTREGIDLPRFMARFGRDFLDIFAPSVARLEALGLIETTSDRLRLSRAGRLLSNAVIREFVESLSQPE